MIREEVELQFGVNNSRVPAGLAENIRAVEEYQTKLEARRNAIEIAGATKTSAQLRSIMKVREAERIAEIERVKLVQMAANAEISAQQKAMNDASFMVLGANRDRNAVRTIETSASGVGFFGMAKNAEKAGEELGKVGHAAGGFSTILRESAVLVREGLRGNFNRMLGSFSILAGAISAWAIPILAGVAAVDAASELMGGPGVYNTWKAFQEKNNSQAGTKEKFEDTADSLRQRVDLMRQAGILDKETADNYTSRLRKPTEENVGSILSATNKLMPKGGTDALAAIPEINRLRAEHNKNINGVNRDELSGTSLLDFDVAHQRSLKLDILAIDTTSLSLTEKQLLAGKTQLELDEADKNVAEDQKKLQEDKNDLIREQTKIQQEAALRISEIQQREMEKFMPTLDELAGHGAFGSQARTIQRTDRRIKREFESGNVAGAQSDIANRDKIYDSLAARGVVAERSEAREIKDLNKQMAIRLSQMGTKNSPIVIVPNMK